MSHAYNRANAHARERRWKRTYWGFLALVMAGALLSATIEILR